MNKTLYIALLIYIVVASVTETLLDILIFYPRKSIGFWAGFFHDVYQKTLGAILILLIMGLYND